MRTNTSITQSEIAAYAQFCVENNIIHDGSPADEANSNFVVDYFLNQWKEDITAANLAQAFPQIKPHLKFHSKAEVDLNKATVSFDETNRKKFAEWFESQTFLVKEGEQGFENAANLLEELRGREVNRETIAAAMGRIEAGAGNKFNTRVRKPLHYFKTERALSPAAQAAQDHKPGEFVSRTDMVRTADGGWRNKNAAEQAADRRLAEAQKNPGQSDRIIEQQAHQEAESLQGNNHSQTDQIRKLFVTKQHSSDIDWVTTLSARKRMQKQFERSAAVSFRRY